MRFLNFETRYKIIKDELSRYCKLNDIYYELSQAGVEYHFEIKCNKEIENRINGFLDAIHDVYF